MSGLISLGLFGLALVLVVIGLLLGLLRGTLKSVIRFVSVVISFVVSLTVCLQFAPRIEALCQDRNVVELVETLGVSVTGADGLLEVLAHFDAATLQYIFMLPASLIAVPLAFVLLFIIISTVFFLVLWVLCLILRIGKGEKTMLSRLIGVGIGFVQSILVAVVIFTPIVGILDTVALVAESDSITVEEGAPIYNEEGALDLGALIVDVGSLARGPMPSVFGALGARAIYSSFTNITVDGEQLDVKAVSAELAEIGFVMLRLNYFNPIEISDVHKVALRDTVCAIDKSEYTEQILSGVMRGIASAYAEGDITLVAGEPYYSFINSIVLVFSDSSKDNVASDFRTIIDIYIIISEERFFHATAESDGKMRETLIRRDENGDMVIDRIMALLDENPRMSGIRSAIGKMSISVMANNISFDADTEAVYSEVKAGLTETLKIDKSAYGSEEEYLDAVAASIEETMTASGIELTPEIYRSMAEHVNENYEAGRETTDADADNLLISYYAAYSTNAQQ